MKIGDIVKVHDEGCSMMLIKGKIQHASGILLMPRTFRVLGINGNYPTYCDLIVETDRNNTLLVDIKDPDFVLFIQECFCHVYKPEATRCSSSPLIQNVRQSASGVDIQIPTGATSVQVTFSVESHS